MGILESAKRFAGQVIGKTGKAIDVVGKALGNPLPEKKISENLQRIGGMLNPVKTAKAAEVPYSPTPAPYSPYIAPAPRPSGGTLAPVPSQPSPGQPSSYEVPSVTKTVPSAEEAARQAAEQRMRRYGELVAPVEKDIEAYLAGRPDISQLYTQEMEKQGIPAKQGVLGTLEAEQKKLGTQLETIPTEEITRRKETGMLTAAAERRIRAMEERPIREQLIKTTGAAETERVGLQRAFDLVDKMLDLVREQEKRGLEPLQTRLEAGRGEFTNEVDALAQRLTGFNKDREAKLDEYKTKVDAGLKLTIREKTDQASLERLQLEHLNTMEEIAAKQKGTIAEDKSPVIESVRARILGGATKSDIMSEFSGQLELPTLEKIFEAYNSTFSANEQGGGSIYGGL